MKPWKVVFHEEFEPEFNLFQAKVQEELLAQMILLRQFGPELGRPRVDTLKGSQYANMKELRFDAANGVWRIAFAFDPHRHAILLVGGDKSGVSKDRFYRQLVAKADRRFRAHLVQLRKEKTR